MAYATSRDERAFSKLAKRYSGLIYQTALRSLGDTMLAEDVSQRVLCVLAAKAGRLSNQTVPLSSWLHRATILEAKTAYRSEIRHRRKKSIPMHDSADSEPDPAWRQALPLLDRAIDALPESDRRVLLLHYFDGLTFPQIAERLGKSAAAVQKQSRRTLLALQRTLGRRGVTLSVGLLATGLSSEFAKAAPAFALPALPAAVKVTLLAMKPNTVIAATVVLCSIPLAVQHQTIDELEKSAMVVNNPSPRSRPAVERPATAAISPVRRLVSDLKAKDHDLPRYLRAIDSLNERSPQEISDLVRQLIADGMSDRDRNTTMLAAFRSLAKKDPKAALDLMLQEVPGQYFCEHHAIHPIFTEALGAWSHSDPIAAYRWFRDHTTGIRNFLSHAQLQGYMEDNLRTFQIGQFLIFASPADATELFKEMPMHKRMGKFGSLGTSPGGSFHTKLRENPDSYIEVVRNLFSEQDAAKMIARAAQASFGGFPDQRVLNSAAEFMDQRRLSRMEIEAVALSAGTDYLTTRTKPQLGEKPLIEGIAAYRQWLYERAIEGADQMIGRALGKVKSYDPVSVGRLLLNHEQHGLTEDAVIGYLETLPRGLEEALLREIAGKLSDSAQAEQLIRKALIR